MITHFEKRVYEVLRKVPKGKIISYGQIAKAIGKPRASRAVANALNKNPFSPKVPCHRVIRSNGMAGGFAGGKKEKIKMLRKEGVEISNKGVVKNYKVLKYQLIKE